MDEEQEQESDSPLFSDFERIGNLLTDAQNLSKENKNYNPASFRDFFVVLYQIKVFLFPMTKNTQRMGTIKEDIIALDKITRNCYRRLINDNKYRVPSEVFEALDSLYQEILILKQETNLGIRLTEKLTPDKKGRISMGLE